MGVAEVPVSVVRLSKEREKALNVIINDRQAQSRFVPPMLSHLLEELRDLPELELSGFDASDLPDLKLAPLPELPPIEEPEQVEITLIVDSATFEQISERLDAFVSEFNLICHVMRR
jgi:hypothetical protein